MKEFLRRSFKNEFLLFYLLFIQTAFCVNAQDSVRYEKSFKVFLIGDAGKPHVEEKDVILSSLAEKLKKAGENSAVIFLGDNIYPDGMPPQDHAARANAESRLKAQLDIIKTYKGKAFIIPGNHDWREGRREGWEYVQEQENFVKEYLGKDDVFYPKGGCPGPVEVSVSDNLTLIILDTQWYFHKREKPGQNGDCPQKDFASVLSSVDSLLKKNDGKEIIIAGHHPLVSKGPHAGYFPWKAHIFPLTDINRNLYIPLPIIGSLYPLSRIIFGSIQDMPHPKYKKFLRKVTELLIKYPGTIYAAGHDHALEYFERDGVTYIVSGSGSKINYVKKAKGNDFTASKTGYAEIVFTEKVPLLYFYKVNDLTPEGEIIFSKKIDPVSVK